MKLSSECPRTRASIARVRADEPCRGWSGARNPAERRKDFGGVLPDHAEELVLDSSDPAAAAAIIQADKERRARNREYARQSYVAVC